jgi:uncharacterized protein YcbK (DUF882 family)
MSVIRLANAAKHYKELPHQLAAWNELQETLGSEQLQTFADLYRAAMVLAEFVQKARDHFGKSAIITSGHRPAKINAQVGGASRSEHLYDAKDTGAVDFYVDGTSVYTLQAWADKEWPYSLGYGAPRGFIHVGMRPGKPRVRWDY